MASMHGLGKTLPEVFPALFLFEPRLKKDTQDTVSSHLE